MASEGISVVEGLGDKGSSLWPLTPSNVQLHIKLNTLSLYRHTLIFLSYCSLLLLFIFLSYPFTFFILFSVDAHIMLIPLTQPQRSRQRTLQQTFWAMLWNKPWAGEGAGRACRGGQGWPRALHSQLWWREAPQDTERHPIPSIRQRAHTAPYGDLKTSSTVHVGPTARGITSKPSSAAS